MFRMFIFRKSKYVCNVFSSTVCYASRMEYGKREMEIESFDVCSQVEVKMEMEKAKLMINDS